MENEQFDEITKKPVDRGYLECGLPNYLQEAIDKIKIEDEIIASGKVSYHWDLAYEELYSSINVAETGQEISSEQAWYLREKYLGLERRSRF